MLMFHRIIMLPGNTAPITCWYIAVVWSADFSVCHDFFDSKINGNRILVLMANNTVLLCTIIWIVNMKTVVSNFFSRYFADAILIMCVCAVFVRKRRCWRQTIKFNASTYMLCSPLQQNLQFNKTHEWIVIAFQPKSINRAVLSERQMVANYHQNVFLIDWWILPWFASDY